MADESRSFGAVADMPIDGPYSALQVQIEERPYGRVCRDVVQLIVRLEQLHKTDLAFPARAELLELLKTDVLSTLSALDIAVADQRPQDDEGLKGSSLKQRAVDLTIRNFSLALSQLDRLPTAMHPKHARVRWWLLRNLFRFVTLQLEHGLATGTAAPSGTWRRLHEQYRYLTTNLKGSLALEDAAVCQQAAEALEVEYKRMLLVGLLARFVSRAERAKMSTFVDKRIRQWAKTSTLKRPSTLGGGFGVFVVDVTADTPPRLETAYLERSFQGWVLEPNATFVELIASPADDQPCYDYGLAFAA